MFNLFRKTLFFVLPLLVAVILWSQIKDLDVGLVKQGFLAINRSSLVFAILLVGIDYILISCYDYLGLRFMGFRPAFRWLFPFAFVSYALNFTLGSLIGGLGFRLRFYVRFGLSKTRIFKLIGFSIFTNWLGFAFITSILVLLRHSPSIEIFERMHALLSFLASLCIALIVFYLSAMRRVWRINSFTRRYIPYVPSKFIIAQLLVSSMHWLLLSFIIYLLSLDVIDVTYFQVALTFQLSAIAGVITHVPGGIGVLESIYMSQLKDVASPALVLSVILVFRSIYYLLPFTLALVMYFLFEWFAKYSSIFQQLKAKASDRQNHPIK
jgi:uncharacterized membrane protein YbhN (UPF0104 family)